MDRISRLPPGIIETILCLLPIQEAARTSILSSEWRYHWIKIPKLVFNENTFNVATDDVELSVWEPDVPSNRIEMDQTSKLFYAIYQVLLMHEGPIHEFTLCMEADESCVEIDHIVRYLLKKNTLKILKLDLGLFNEWYELPVSLFSLHQLTHMHLHSCALVHKRSFTEFGCLTTLYLGSIQTHEKTIVRFLSSCPVLKRLTLRLGAADILYSVDAPPLVDLFKCFLEIEYLSVSFFIVTGYVFKKVPKELPTTFVHLKYLCMNRLGFGHKFALPFLALLIRCSPNLEKLKLEMDEDDDWLEEEMGPNTIEDYSDIMLEHLNELEIQHFCSYDDEFDFLKLIYASSPFLKKVMIFPSYGCDEDEKSHILETLSGFPCASPVVVVEIKIIPLRLKPK